jgi:hypothetical protein
MNQWHCTFESDHIQFHDYPFAAASVSKQGALFYSDICEVLPTRFPPEVRTHQGEVLFIPAVQRDELTRIATQHQLPITDRIDLWAMLLEPFLDTEHSPAEQARTLALLAQYGVPNDETRRIRSQVARIMLAYNFASGLWEWVHLGLFDLLNAYLADLGDSENETFAHHYWQAMEIAKLEQVSSH